MALELAHGITRADTSQRMKKIRSPIMPIGVTALDLGYSVLTRNARHFPRVGGA
jgi:predicted nucleic acid-binding protein